VPVGERAPQRAGLAFQTPTGLIHVKRAGHPGPDPTDPHTGR
jgi:hypothetical protein